MPSLEHASCQSRESDPLRRYAEELLAEPWPEAGVDTGCPLCALRSCAPEERRRWLRALPMEEIEALVVRHWFCRSQAIDAVTAGVR